MTKHDERTQTLLQEINTKIHELDTYLKGDKTQGDVYLELISKVFNEIRDNFAMVSHTVPSTEEMSEYFTVSQQQTFISILTDFLHDTGVFRHKIDLYHSEIVENSF